LLAASGAAGLAGGTFLIVRAACGDVKAGAWPGTPRGPPNSRLMPGPPNG